ncbi:MAG: FKBP-type peptidyl-prolyl cis-trans isomerase [Phycisphaerales bacterium JB037]
MMPSSTDRTTIRARVAAAAAIATLALAGCKTHQRTDADNTPAVETALAPDGTEYPVLNTVDLGEGLIARDLRIGTGPEIKLDDVMVVHTVGTYPVGGPRGGRVFYSTIEDGAPLTWPVKRLIQGWQRGVPGMKVGGIRTLSVPWPLAYGAEGKPNPEDPGAGIPPKADLHFTIELLGVNPPDFDRSDLPD